MADITMCYGENCEQKEKCYRYTAPIDCYGQSVFANTPKEKPCPHFWDNTGRRDGRKIGVWWGDFRKIRKHQDEEFIEK